MNEPQNNVDKKIADALGIKFNFTEDSVLHAAAPEIFSLPEEENILDLDLDPENTLLNEEEFITDDGVDPVKPVVNHPNQHGIIRHTPDPEDRLEIVLDSSREEKLLDRDFNDARLRLKRLVERGEEMFEQAFGFAEADQSPRYYQTAGELFNNLIAANDKLLKIHEDRHNIKKKTEEKNVSSAMAAPGQTSNNLFVGTASELMKLLQEQKSTQPARDIIEANDTDVSQ